jgi:hypothetical protein
MDLNNHYCIAWGPLGSNHLALFRLDNACMHLCVTVSAVKPTLLHGHQASTCCCFRPTCSAHSLLFLSNLPLSFAGVFAMWIWFSCLLLPGGRLRVQPTTVICWCVELVFRVLGR